MKHWTILLIVLTFLSAPSAFALSQDWGGLEDDWTVAGAYYKNPTPIYCRANAPDDEACRACVTQYADDGQPTGTIVCGYVRFSAACKCDYTSGKCAPVGTCTYLR